MNCFSLLFDSHEEPQIRLMFPHFCAHLTTAGCSRIWRPIKGEKGGEKEKKEIEIKAIHVEVQTQQYVKRKQEAKGAQKCV
mmetsp:Transcript_26038/g.66118  ORF Transcript_26038/g.66118 Transcript_26038/m.66118 type:complete len:81 (+) Transcript_26038:1220-1462(+)